VVGGEPDAVEEGDGDLADRGDLDVHPIGGAHGQPAEPADGVVVPRGVGGEGGEGGHHESVQELGGRVLPESVGLLVDGVGEHGLRDLDEYPSSLCARRWSHCHPGEEEDEAEENGPVGLLGGFLHWLEIAMVGVAEGSQLLEVTVSKVRQPDISLAPGEDSNK